ncbi:MAG: hypothetical protein IKR63_06225 [Alloprevotella sp.]|nr:hypothetical protein [Alloprevotella sp.]
MSIFTFAARAPERLKAVGRILAACGAAEPVEFDAYTELFDFSLRLSYE